MDAVAPRAVALLAPPQFWGGVYEGRYCVNDLHRASGGAKRHAPNEFLRLRATKALISELTGDSRLAPVESMRGGTSPGTYVARELVYAHPEVRPHDPRNFALVAPPSRLFCRDGRQHNDGGSALNAISRCAWGRCTDLCIGRSGQRERNFSFTSLRRLAANALRLPRTVAPILARPPFATHRSTGRIVRSPAPPSSARWITAASIASRCASYVCKRPYSVSGTRNRRLTVSLGTSMRTRHP